MSSNWEGQHTMQKISAERNGSTPLISQTYITLSGLQSSRINVQLQ